jgi:hypothetical protein
MGTKEREGRDENFAVRRPSRLRKDILDYKYYASRTPESTFEIFHNFQDLVHQILLITAGAGLRYEFCFRSFKPAE